MRRIIFAPGEHYHIFSRGTEKRPIFLDERDFTRCLLILLLFQAPIPVKNLDRLFKKFLQNIQFVQSRGLHINDVLGEFLKEFSKSRFVELVAFTLMNNHFHLLLHELKDGGVSKYMQRVCGAYAKYFNTKYNRQGHLFSGPFGARHIGSNEYLNHISAYIHSNIAEVNFWKGKEEQYPWSSYQDYLSGNRWGEFLRPDIITEQFKNANDYKNFVKESWILSDEIKQLKRELN